MAGAGDHEFDHGAGHLIDHGEGHMICYLIDIWWLFSRYRAIVAMAD